MKATAVGEPVVLTSPFSVLGSCSGSVRSSKFCVRSSGCGAKNRRPNYPPNLNTNREPRTQKREHNKCGSSDLIRIVIDVDRLQVGVDVERLRPGLAPAVAGLSESTERQVGLAAVSAAVHDRDT